MNQGRGRDDLAAVLGRPAARMRDTEDTEVGVHDIGTLKRLLSMGRGSFSPTTVDVRDMGREGGIALVDVVLALTLPTDLHRLHLGGDIHRLLPVGGDLIRLLPSKETFIHPASEEVLIAFSWRRYP